MAEAPARIMQAGAYDQPDLPGARASKKKRGPNPKPANASAGDDSQIGLEQEDVEVHELDTMA